MGKALELVSGGVVAPSSTQAPLLVFSGNSFTVRNSTKKARLLSAWVRRQGAGTLRITSSLLHDTTFGIQQLADIGHHMVGPIGELWQDLEPQDTLAVSMSGSAVAGDIEQASLLISYDDLPGSDGLFIDPAELDRRKINVVGVRNNLAPSGATNAYVGPETISAEDNVLKANTWYAIMGYTLQGASCCSVRWTSPDFGNIGVGGPGRSGAEVLTQGWFIDLSRRNQMPLIPTFNSSNRDQTIVDYAQNEVAGALGLTTYLAQLGSPGRRA